MYLVFSTTNPSLIDFKHASFLT